MRLCAFLIELISPLLSPILCRLPNILEYLREPLQAGLGDRSPYVRKTSVMGIVKLFHVAPEFVEGMHLYMYVLHTEIFADH